MKTKNDIQKNFIKQMKKLERDIKKEEKQNKGVFTNTLYKERFYGYHDIDAERKETKNRRKNKFLKSVLLLILIILIFIIPMIFSCSQLTKDNVLNSFKYGEYEETIKYCETILMRDPSDYLALLYKGRALLSLDNYIEAIANLEKAKKMNPDDDMLLVYLGYSHYKLYHYDEALKNLNTAIKINSKNSDAYIWKGYCFVEIGRYDEALECMDLMDTFDHQNAHGNNVRGLAHAYCGNYKEAIKYYEKAIEVFENEDSDEEKFEIAYTNIAWALYNQKTYTECIEFCNTIKEFFPGNYDIPYCVADCYVALGDSEKAISAYQEAVAINSDDANLFSDMGWVFFNMEEYDKACHCVDRAKKLNSENYNTKLLQESLEYLKKPESERILNFIKENYLYYDEINNFDEKAEKFITKEELDSQDIYNLLESIRKEDDPFTFFVYDELYDQMLEDEKNNQIEYQLIDGKYHYVGIKSFTSDIAEAFYSVVDQIENPSNQILVIDLRDNPGGLCIPANNILDILLPKCCTSYMVERNGEIYSFYSDQNQVNFKHIYIFVNSKSASSSELLTLGLKTYLKNVTVIGEPTVGKGVAQVTFENKKKRYMIFLVNSYWNIKEKNISGSKIQPDIYLSSDNFSDYINVIRKQAEAGVEAVEAGEAGGRFSCFLC